MNKSRIYCNSTTIIFTLAAICNSFGCGPGPSWDGGDDFGDTGFETDSGSAGDGDGDPGDGDPGDGDGDPTGDGDGDTPKCIEQTDGLTCWITWAGEWARVLMPCEVSNAVMAGVWAELGPDHFADWGDVECYAVPSADVEFCVTVDDWLLLIEGPSGWAVHMSTEPDSHPAVDAPC